MCVYLRPMQKMTKEDRIETHRIANERIAEWFAVRQYTLYSMERARRHAGFAQGVPSENG